MEWADLRVGREEHAFICGINGSGKSELAQWIVNDQFKPYSVVYDPKHSRTVGNWQGQTYIYDWNELIESDARRIVYRPSLAAYEKDGRWVNEAEDADRQEEFFRFVFERQRTRLVVDEAAALLGGSNPSYHLRACLTRGRELGISCVCLTQRPVSIPLIMLSEARRVYIFRLNLEEDRRRIDKLTGFSDEEQQTLREHEFFFFDTKHGKYPSKIKLDLSRLPQPIPRPLFGAPSHLERGATTYA